MFDMGRLSQASGVSSMALPMVGTMYGNNTYFRPPTIPNHDLLQKQESSPAEFASIVQAQSPQDASGIDPRTGQYRPGARDARSLHTHEQIMTDPMTRDSFHQVIVKGLHPRVIRAVAVLMRITNDVNTYHMWTDNRFSIDRTVYDHLAPYAVPTGMNMRQERAQSFGSMIGKLFEIGMMSLKTRMGVVYLMACISNLGASLGRTLAKITLEAIVDSHNVDTSSLFQGQLRESTKRSLLLGDSDPQSVNRIISYWSRFFNGFSGPNRDIYMRRVLEHGQSRLRVSNPTHFVLPQSAIQTDETQLAPLTQQEMAVYEDLFGSKDAQDIVDSGEAARIAGINVLGVQNYNVSESKQEQPLESMTTVATGFEVQPDVHERERMNGRDMFNSSSLDRTIFNYDTDRESTLRADQMYGKCCLWDGNAMRHEYQELLDKKSVYGYIMEQRGAQGKRFLDLLVSVLSDTKTMVAAMSTETRKFWYPDEVVENPDQFHVDYKGGNPAPSGGGEGYTPAAPTAPRSPGVADQSDFDDGEQVQDAVDEQAGVRVWDQIFEEAGVGRPYKSASDGNTYPGGPADGVDASSLRPHTVSVVESLRSCFPRIDSEFGRGFLQVAAILRRSTDSSGHSKLPLLYKLTGDVAEKLMEIEKALDCYYNTYKRVAEEMADARNAPSYSQIEREHRNETWFERGTAAKNLAAILFMDPSEGIKAIHEAAEEADGGLFSAQNMERVSNGIEEMIKERVADRGVQENVSKKEVTGPAVFIEHLKVQKVENMTRNICVESIRLGLPPLFGILASRPSLTFRMGTGALVSAPVVDMFRGDALTTVAPNQVNRTFAVQHIQKLQVSVRPDKIAVFPNARLLGYVTGGTAAIHDLSHEEGVVAFRGGRWEGSVICMPLLLGDRDLWNEHNYLTLDGRNILGSAPSVHDLDLRFSTGPTNATVLNISVTPSDLDSMFSCSPNKDSHSSTLVFEETNLRKSSRHGVETRVMVRVGTSPVGYLLPSPGELDNYLRQGPRSIDSTPSNYYIETG